VRGISASHHFRAGSILSARSTATTLDTAALATSHQRCGSAPLAPTGSQIGRDANRNFSDDRPRLTDLHGDTECTASKGPLDPERCVAVLLAAMTACSAMAGSPGTLGAAFSRDVDNTLGDLASPYLRDRRTGSR
jgi:hypothetical protein